MKVWLTDLPLWKSAASLCRWDSTTAFAICLAFPFMPCALALSAVNQRVRRCRGRLCKDKESEQLCMTERMSELIAGMAEWNWVRVTFWIYVMASVMMIYKMTPIFLNVLLAWMSHVMADLSFTWICLSTFAAGMVLFMLPPIPGPPIYLFGGVVISEKCPWGFWWGSIVCIVLCFILKLTACAVQQKLFGEMLGNVQSVRRAVGVHKPFIRAIEMVLRRPGLSFGKCMILCGGPDWPTSVLAGILRISLRQCLLGTVPIILNVVPLTLTGSFYLKRDVSQVWIRAGNLMFSVVALVSVVFWVGMGWAIQDVFEREHENLTRAKEEYIDLEWLDHRASLMTAKCAVVWSDLFALFVKAPYFSGAACLVLVGVAFFWRSALCFGSFKVTDDMEALVWFGSDGLIRSPGAVGLALAAVGYMGLVTFKMWAWQRSRFLRAVAEREVDSLEVEWKAQRLEAARTAATTALTPRGFGGSSLPHSLLPAEGDAATSTADTNSMERGEAHGSQEKVAVADVEDASRAPGRPCLLTQDGGDATRIGVLMPIQEKESPNSRSEAKSSPPPSPPTSPRPGDASARRGTLDFPLDESPAEMHEVKISVATHLQGMSACCN
eukprot:CAMPEP_0175747828 /NCGR_PEP_ID=MMETSP0097-20121207/59304_1 /TAXON_ID=311494 /ORGANISM="Alexandrium monilatum, Strain CCMP3105" /LENGTH=608 /DNA_ID=CAMNT_0017056301 /DNA_START=1 /DNA_END=1825 /DNA_ORIENTATION=-